MAKIKGKLAAIYMQTSASAQYAAGEAMEQVSGLWYKITDTAKQYWDKSQAIIIYDDAVPETPLEIAYAGGYVRLGATPVGAVTADIYYFACSQIGGARSHSIDAEMDLIDATCYGEDAEVVEPSEIVKFSGQVEGFFTCVDSSLSTAQGANKDLTFTSLLNGLTGDILSVEYVVAGVGTVLSVEVQSTYAVVVNLATTDPGGVADSTAEEIRDAVNQHAAARLLVRSTFAVGSNGTGNPSAMAHTHLAGGVDASLKANDGAYSILTTSQGANKDLTFVAYVIGVVGDDVSMTYAVAGNLTPLSVDVVGTAITVNLETDGGGAAISTAEEVRDAVNVDGDANILVTAYIADGSTGAGVPTAMGATNLAGGIDPGTSEFQLGDDLIIVLYEDSGAALRRVEGLCQLEKVSIKSSLKELIGRTITFRGQGMLYEHQG